MARRTSNRKAVLMGLLAGAMFGVTQGLLRDNVWVGLVMGLFFGLGMGLAMRHVWGSTALNGLDRRERRAISRAMRRGEPVEDPRLARPLVDQVDAFLAMPFPVWAVRVLFGLLAVLGLVVAVLEFRGGEGVGGGVLLLVISLAMLFGLLPWVSRQRARFRQSQEATWRRHSDVSTTAD
ncbi:hypothetical protein AB0A74_13310 [Saccharothrix sp. NPDC042600]|uniref:hypothetical protein n=1 Tax=Saccharothrix TaxID=2071 RepID=UPI0033F20B3C|nr:hypothetical protein GCM10017745_38430 [Saccharothrix mutabilis subsp. capreolus]